MKKYLSVIILFVFIAGCRVLDITDDQAAAIAKSAGDAAGQVLTTATSPFLTPAGGAGVGALGALAIAALTKWVLSMLQKKGVQLPPTTTP